MCSWWSVLRVEGAESVTLTQPTSAHPVSFWTDLWVSGTASFTFRQPSVILFSIHGITLQHYTFKKLPLEILSRTHTLLPRSKRLQQHFGPIASIGNAFVSTFPLWWTKDKKLEGHNSKFITSNIFSQNTSVDFMSVDFILIAVWTSCAQMVQLWTCFVNSFIFTLYMSNLEMKDNKVSDKRWMFFLYFY